MVKMINGRFGNEMWVDDNRVDEYIAAGNRLAEDPVKHKPRKKQTATKKGPAKK